MNNEYLRLCGRFISVYFYRHRVFYDVREEGKKGTKCMNFYLLNAKKALTNLINSDDWLFPLWRSLNFPKATNNRNWVPNVSTYVYFNSLLGNTSAYFCLQQVYKCAGKVIFSSNSKRIKYFPSYNILNSFSCSKQTFCTHLFTN